MRPPYPAPNVRDDRETPLLTSAGWAKETSISEKQKEEYFSLWDWTGGIRLKRLAKSVF
jgi:hypothetical protein